MSQATSDRSDSSDNVYPVTTNNLLLYRIRAFDAYLGLTHAIFTRKGGVSQAPYHSLNLGSTVGDEAEAVRKNFEQACQAVNITPDQTVSSYLVHDRRILTINKTNRQQVMGQADGLITSDPDVYLFMRFADCTPLIFYDPIRGAVGLSHAGWRGTMQNVADATVTAMVNQLGCQPPNIIAVIGPAIGPCCYEVGPEVMAAATERFADPTTLFIHRNGRANYAHFDMWEANRRQLAASGVEQTIQSKICTACHTAEFFSHRAEKGRTGRFGVIIGLRGEKG
jgi:YfiH family protein